LFIAASGSHDPLSADYSLSAEPHAEISTEQSAAYPVAQRAVKQPEWEAQQILSSAEYLKNIFEDSGGSLDGPLSSEARDKMIVKARDKMNADGMSRSRITNSQLSGFLCVHPGCTAQPFQIQVSMQSCTDFETIQVLTQPSTF
jgi:hypothetical protein